MSIAKSLAAVAAALMVASGSQGAFASSMHFPSAHPRGRQGVSERHDAGTKLARKAAKGKLGAAVLR